MKMAPHPAIANGKANHVGDAVAVVIAETLAQAKDAGEKVKVDYEVLPAVADPAKAQAQGRAADPRRRAAATRSIKWHLGDQKATEAAFKSAKHVTKLDIINNRLVPNAIEPRAAIADYDAGTDSLTLWNTSQNPHVARLVIAAFVGMAPEHKLRVIAPDVGGGFGSKIFIYPEEVVCAVGVAPGRPAGEMDCRPLRSLPHRRAWPRSRHARRDGVRRRRQDHRRCGRRPSPISAPTCRPSRRRCRPISTRRCCRASTTSRRSIARSMRSTPTPCRSTPIAAPAGRRRPSWSSGWSRSARARSGSIRRTCASATSSRPSRTRRRSSWPTTPATMTPR